MPELEQKDKDDALDAHETYDFLVDVSSFLTPIAAGFVVAAPAAPIIGAGIALMGFLCKRKAKTLKRIADDPPDPSFEHPARRRALTLQLEWLTHDPPGYQFARAARDLWASEAEMRAFVASVEKAEGAEIAEQAYFRTARLYDALVHAALGAQYLRETGKSMAELADQLESALPQSLSDATDLPPTTDETRGTPALSDVMHDETAAALFRIGLTRTQVDRTIRRSFPLEEWPARRTEYIRQVRAAGQASARFAGTLDAWASRVREGGDFEPPPPGTLRW